MAETDTAFHIHLIYNLLVPVVWVSRGNSLDADQKAAWHTFLLPIQKQSAWIHIGSEIESSFQR